MSLVWEMDLSTSEKMVLLVIADHADDEGRNAWPSMQTIARKASLSHRQAKRIVAALRDGGWIVVEEQAGGTREMRDDRRPNRYTVLPNGGTSASSRDVARGDIEDPRGDICDSHGGSPMTPKPSIEPSLIEPPINIDDRRFAAQHFDTFWNIYPRKVGKQAAAAAFKKACEVEDPIRIHQAAARFRDDPNREDQFTPHPTTWLNQGRWDDDPLPSRSGSGTRAYLEAAETFSGVNTYLELGAGDEPF